MQYNLDLAEAQLFSYERDCAQDDLIDGHRFIVYRSYTAEGAEVGNNLSRLAHLLHRAVQLLQDMLRVRHAKFDQVNGIAYKEADVVQGVIEFMSDAGSEFSERC